MNLHEYQAKQLFARFGIPVSTGEVADSPKSARSAAATLGGDLWVVKAQVHAGGRGKAGGVKLAKSLDEVEAAAAAMLGQRLITKQTVAEGLPINQVFVESGSNIERELYMSIVVDRAAERIAFMVSEAGGMDIEEVAVATPEKIFTVAVNPGAGLQPYQVRKMGFGLGLTAAQLKQFGVMCNNLYRLFCECDLSMLEINPLIVDTKGDLLALDAKINIEDNALFRQPDLVSMRDLSQEDEKESKAAAYDLNYVSLDGNIACMVNGAGLAMATMDLIQLHGGEPANFLDVGGGATPERVSEAFKLILSNTSVKAILVNIFGGIVRCDLIAEGIIQAVREVNVNVPVVARLEGTNVKKGRELLANSGLDILTADNLTDAATKVVAAAA
ncbi:MAG: ADP-forming succinate--CoA ligase subunit beta [Gammaproteobacteria bacterium]|nr:ADP-forming succinate--CoA ligase subunit beta [Gammaproteobacteria bacterium]MCP4088627.1 ADP-forming succinate--CoA ligase subunit beta [Gammaproteobacteria bacterium]MCP4276465.1 ADP-forming succinate--CoA ligase subunit beta [Gammaproteobacteria bacterium]MCP4832342.1 ADP-forming succinate--CoA ligase subunit beta [Gammaproteobacteria bacterium]MCP4929144.1 ADP-forming succinate--CoA ligase subunit beta [Gammaproteobacteria bacterium]